MVKSIGEAVSGVDAGVLVTEPRRVIREEERQLLRQLQAQKLPVILAINKIDTLEDKSVLLACIDAWRKEADFARRAAPLRPDRRGCGRPRGRAVGLCV